MRRCSSASQATIFVPSIASPAKLERIRGYGAELVVGGERYADALAASEEYVARTGALPVHAYDQPETLLGQGTVGLELEEEAPDIDTLLVAVGGGGLIGGIAAWYRRPRPDRRRRAGSGADAAPGACSRASRSTRRPAASPPIRSRRSGRRADVPDRAALRRARRRWSTDEAIRDAQRVLWDELRIVARAGRRGGVRGAALRALRARAGRAGRRAAVRRQHRRRSISAAVEPA